MPTPPPTPREGGRRRTTTRTASTAPPAPLQVDACPLSATVVSSPGSTSPDAASTSPSQVRTGDDDGGDDGPAALQGSFYWEVPVPVAAGRGRGRGGGRGGGRGRGARGGAARGRSGLFRKRTAAAVELPAEPATPSAGKLAVAEVSMVDMAKAAETPEAKPKPEEAPALRELALSLPTGQLAMVAGPVGSGKSSALTALLGEMRALNGATATLVGAVAYVAQTPFIMNDWLRGNILFGREMDERAVPEDARGARCCPTSPSCPPATPRRSARRASTSRAARRRASPWRAPCYAQADVYLLDDPLSAVDATSAATSSPACSGRAASSAPPPASSSPTRTQWLCRSPIKVILLKDGAVVAQGGYTELRERHGGVLARSRRPRRGRRHRAPTSPATRRAAEEPRAGDGRGRGRPQEGGGRPDQGRGQLVKDEASATGSVSWAMHLKYARAMGGALFGLLLITMLCFDRAFQVGRTTGSSSGSTRRALWARQYLARRRDRRSGCAHLRERRWGAAWFVYLRSAYFNIGMGLRAARVLYSELSDAILGAPTSFFETTPTGRILNRFTSDTEQMDNLLMQNMQQWLNCVMPVIGTLCLIAVVSPVFLAWVLLLVVLYLALMRYSAPATRDLQRLGERQAARRSSRSSRRPWRGSRRSARSVRRRASKTVMKSRPPAASTHSTSSHSGCRNELDLLGISIIFLIQQRNAPRL